MGSPNLSRETKCSGANGTGKIKIISCSADHDQHWQPHPVDAESAESDNC